MAVRIIFRPSALHDLDRLSPEVRQRILEKLEWYASQDEPLDFAHRLTDSTLGQYRYRVGDWRVIFDLKQDVIVILVVDHRRKAYR